MFHAPSGTRFVKRVAVPTTTSKTRIATLLPLLLLLCSASLQAQWKEISSAVDYAEFSPQPPFTYHVTRVDLTDPSVAVVASSESERGAIVTAYAKRIDAIAAVNGDYFDEQMRPIGIAVGSCGTWKGRGSSQRKEAFIAAGDHKVAIIEGADVASSGIPEWTRFGVSGWPMLVRDCKALSAAELPGSDAFTRAPHPRTAVGLSNDGTKFYLVVADGVSGNSAGVTLADLGAFMQSQLNVCSAVNLDGGGSSAMAIGGKLVTSPSGGQQRVVANHIAVVDSSNLPSCTSSGANAPRVVANADFWGDVREITGRGTAAGASFTIPLRRAGISGLRVGDVALDSGVLFGMIRLQRLQYGVAVSGIVPLLAGDAARVSAALRSVDGKLVTLDSAENGSLTWGVFYGSASSSDAAHAIRQITDALKLTTEPSSKRVDPLLSSAAKVGGAMAHASGQTLRVTIPLPATVSIDKTAMPPLFGASELSLQKNGRAIAMTGVIIVPSSRAEAAKATLADARIRVTDSSAWPAASGYTAMAVAGRGAGDTLVRAVVAAVGR